MSGRATCEYDMGDLARLQADFGGWFGLFILCQLQLPVRGRRSGTGQHVQNFSTFNE